MASVCARHDTVGAMTIMGQMVKPEANTSEKPVHHVQAYFQRLGDTIAAELGEGSEAVYANLQRVAANQLENFNPSAHITHDDLIDYMLSADTLCKQADLDGKFAEPPLSLYHGGDFDISALIWLDGTTSIHQHAFCGAFHVLAGSSIHSRFQFDARQPTAKMQRAIPGRLRLVGLEVLHAGDTRIIARGSDLIHSLFHMIRPSLTIVIRTITDDPDAEVQYDYRWPGLAFDPFQRHAPTIRKLQYLRMLRALGKDAVLVHLHRVLANADLLLAYLLISEQTRISADPEQARELAAVCAALPAEERQLLAQVVHNDLLSQTVIDCRRKLHDPGHRFLLALLLNVFDRQELLRLVQREFHVDDPVDQVMAWVAEMTGNTERFANLIGLDFSTTELRMLTSMFRGAGLHAVLAQFSDRYGAAEVASQGEKLSALFVALKSCALFHHIFADLTD
ncbi:MAG TPA: hypothetical protein VFN25_12880 [Dokdonella sp.]|uniref:hypothetical protein n=1 Tax=Dokdonella sp. TaxID=2291710 RepID=UPI002D7EDECC|nr:hypothetical protein [Dokdonella sp.]HET9033784.1 hypothetical protein [Dokdonella sp.]